MRRKRDFIFNPNTEIELIAIRGSEVFKKIMRYGDALDVKKKPGWTYKYYEIGFSQFKLTE